MVQKDLCGNKSTLYCPFLIEDDGKIPIAFNTQKSYLFFSLWDLDSPIPAYSVSPIISECLTICNVSPHPYKVGKYSHFTDGELGHRETKLYV